jgi:hypothetical protein
MKCHEQAQMLSKIIQTCGSLSNSKFRKRRKVVTEMY